MIIKRGRERKKSAVLGLTVNEKEVVLRVKQYGHREALKGRTQHRPEIKKKPVLREGPYGEQRKRRQKNP